MHPAGRLPFLLPLPPLRRPRAGRFRPSAASGRIFPGGFSVLPYVCPAEIRLSPDPEPSPSAHPGRERQDYRRKTPRGAFRLPSGPVIEFGNPAKVEWDRETTAMIEVTKLNGDKMVVNADHLELVEAHPDTTLVLGNERRIVVRDSVADIVRKVTEYQRSIRTRTDVRVGGERTD